MRILAIDHGDARAGTAVSDPSATIVRPLGVVSPPEPADLARVAEQAGAELIVVGLPVSLDGAEGEQWMKKVYLYVGKHQRLTGEVKKLPRAIAVIRKRDGVAQTAGEGDEDENAELEIVDLVKFKILFSSRPEPVGALVGS